MLKEFILQINKEVGLSLINGFTLALLVILFGYIINQELVHSIAIAISMMSVIIVAALIGTFVPIILDKKGIDPAIATGLLLQPVMIFWGSIYFS